MAVTTRNRENAQPKRDSKDDNDNVKQEEPPQKQQKKNHKPKTNNSNAIAKNEKNQPLLDKLDQLANAMFSAQDADSKNRFKGVAMKRAVNALADVEFEIKNGDSVFKGDNKIPGVGEGTKSYIDEYMETGEIKEIDDYAKLGEQAEEEEGKGKKKPAASEKVESDGHESDDELTVVNINRAPVLTLWVTVVAQREGFSREEAVTYGKWVATIFAQSKGRALGKFKTKKGPPAEEHEVEGKKDAVDHVTAFGDMRIPVTKDAKGNRVAVLEEEPVEPSKVEDYLNRKFGDQLKETEAAMKELADNMELEELKENAYDLYTQIRPEWKGWGKKGALNLSEIKQLAHHDEN